MGLPFRRGARTSDAEVAANVRRRVATGAPPFWALDTTQQDRLVELAVGFVRRTRWESARGFQLSDDQRALIAALACLLLVGLDLDEYTAVRNVIVHRSTIVQRGRRATGIGRVESSGPLAMSGQAHHRGPVLLSWAAVAADLRSPRRGQNVVLHEFAHQLDMIDGIVDGTPPFEDDDDRRRWAEVCTRAYDAVRARGAEPSVLRAYAGTNPGEFFAVATEVLFTRPVELREEQPELYRELSRFYGQDPASRLAPAG